MITATDMADSIRWKILLPATEAGSVGPLAGDSAIGGLSREAWLSASTYIHCLNVWMLVRAQGLNVTSTRTCPFYVDFAHFHALFFGLRGPCLNREQDYKENLAYIPVGILRES